MEYKYEFYYLYKGTRSPDNANVTGNGSILLTLKQQYLTSESTSSPVITKFIQETLNKDEAFISQKIEVTQVALSSIPYRIPSPGFLSKLFHSKSQTP